MVPAGAADPSEKLQGLTMVISYKVTTDSQVRLTSQGSTLQSEPASTLPIKYSWSASDGALSVFFFLQTGC